MKLAGASFFSILLFLLAGCGNITKDTTAAQNAAEQFHHQLDAGNFKAIYDATDPDFKKTTTEKDFTDLLSAIHRKLGKFISASGNGWNMNSNNLVTSVTLTYNCKYDGGDATEEFTYRFDGDNPKLYGFHINSQALILK